MNGEKSSKQLKEAKTNFFESMGQEPPLLSPAEGGFTSKISLRKIMEIFKRHYINPHL